MAGNFSKVLFNSIMLQPESNRQKTSGHTLDRLSGKARMLKRRPEFSVSSNIPTFTTTTTTSNDLDPDSILQLINGGYEEFTHSNITYALYSFSRDDDYLVIRTTQQILEDDDLHILVVGGGGSGAAATDESSNGGGGGGGIGDVKIITPSSDIYEIKFSVGKGGDPAGSEDNGHTGGSSIVNIYKNSLVFYSITSDGGGKGSTDSRGQGGLSYSSIVQEDLAKGYIFYRGGNGGDEDDGQSVTLLNSSYPEITNETTDLSKYSPINILEHSSGGGGSKRQPADVPGYYGGLGGGNQRLMKGSNSTDADATNPYLGGYVGDNMADGGYTTSQRENGSILEGYGYVNDVVNDGYYGGNGLFPGCGGGAGGCSLNLDNFTQEITIGTSFASGRGADGIIKLCIKKSSAHKIVVGYKTEQGSTDNYYYWVFQTNKTIKYKALKTIGNANLVCVGGGGGGGGSGHGVSNGGGGGGLTYKYTVSNMSNGSIYSFLCGAGGEGGEPGMNNASMGNTSVFRDETSLQEISAGGGHPGNTTASGDGSSESSNTFSNSNITIIHGAKGGDKTKGNDTSASDLFPLEFDNILTSLSIPHNFGGGGGGSKEDADHYDYSGGIGAVSNVGGVRGSKNTYPTDGSHGLFGGGGGAGGYADDGDRHFGGNGGNGIIMLWVDKRNVT